ncbi:uncharacterized protein LOC142240589 [Haematobia irritans]|uniref:uncharacterized protein LOC142240589 n=1 Tax=Haematobia irritans TaxID=7368 RepID=UPI003F509DDE
MAIFISNGTFKSRHKNRLNLQSASNFFYKIFYMALKIEEAMDMSLDEYIAMSKKSNDGGISITGKNSNKNKCQGTVSNDAKFGRRKNMDDEEEDEDALLMDDEDVPKDTTSSTLYESAIWKGPDSSIAYLDCNNKQNDLRERLNSTNNSHNNNNNNNNNNNRFAVSAIQYRLKAPNISADRPRGLPTLLPLDAYVKKQNDGYNNYNYRNRGRGGNRNRNRGRMNNNNGYNNNGNYGGGNSMGMINNGRIQRNRNQNMSKNLKLTLNCNDPMTPPSHPKNMVIECPSDSINLSSSPNFNSCFQRPTNVTGDMGNKRIPVGGLTPQAQAVLNLESNTNQISTGTGDNLKDLLGFQGNLAGDMMPVFASRLIDLIKNNVQPPVHKPVYDMKIQKEIHEVQNKPLAYKCPGGEVVSSDGAGVNCKIIPRTSGISLNCRFA